MNTTIGQLMILKALPEGMRQKLPKLDKKGAQQLFQELNDKYPEHYKDVLQGLSDLGKTASWEEGVSVSLAELQRSPEEQALIDQAKARVQEIVDNDDLDPLKRKQLIVEQLLSVAQVLPDKVLEAAKNEDSHYATQVMSGARGKKTDLNSIRGADLAAAGPNNEILPVGIFNSYAQGLTPAQFFAGTYSQRNAMVQTKLATGQAGFLGKKLAGAAHRLVVTRKDPIPTRLTTGLPVSVSDKDNIGAVLAADVGTFKRGDIITSQMLDALKDQDVDELLIHSPITDLSDDGGISAVAAGKRLHRGLSPIGENVGLLSAQAISEKVSQGMLSSKHSSNVVKNKAKREGFDYLNSLVEAPEHFEGAGPLAEEDGVVEEIKEAPQGGHYVKVGKKEYYLDHLLTPTVKVGDNLEAGDDLSDGIPHPAKLVKYRGIGEARRVYSNLMKEALDNSGIGVHRRNVETVATGMLNWARVTNPDGIGDNIYDDITPVNRLAYNYKPRANAKEADIDQSVGSYLEEPALHHLPGTRITKKVAKQLKKWGINKAFINADPPDFEPEMVRGVMSVYHDPDWKTRLSGFYTASAFNKSLHRGAVSDTNSTSFVPGLTSSPSFGSKLTTMGKYGAALASKLASTP